MADLLHVSGQAGAGDPFDLVAGCVGREALQHPTGPSVDVRPVKKNAWCFVSSHHNNERKAKKNAGP